jgi:hypothetical protein
LDVGEHLNVAEKICYSATSKNGSVRVVPIPQVLVDASQTGCLAQERPFLLTQWLQFRPARFAIALHFFEEVALGPAAGIGEDQAASRDGDDVGFQTTGPFTSSAALGQPTTCSTGVPLPVIQQ